MGTVLIEDALTTFGPWVKERRKALGLTRDELADLIACSTSLIKKIELEQRCPSRQIIELLILHLQIGPTDRKVFWNLLRTKWPRARKENAAPSQRLLTKQRLPAPSTLLIGREQEVVDVCSLLQRQEVRLLTLTGPGGVGKTRLALKTATALEHQFEDGVHFINLAPINDAALVIPTVAKTLNVRESPGKPMQESLLDFLANRDLLLVLDNFEHLLPAVTDVADCLAAAIDLKILVTSRTVLHLSGEYEFVVPSLELPNLQHLLDFDDLAQLPSVALFVQRAQAARMNFALTTENASTVAEICVRLDGLPLAIELAAARSKTLRPANLLALLKESDPSASLSLLAREARDLPARQQSMRQAIDWSYKLLNASEQTLFRGMGVFVGGATLEAIQAVCGGANATEPESTAILSDHLTALTDSSLLWISEGKEGQSRFMMLETLHKYALEHLAAHNELDLVRHRHAAYFAEFVEEAIPHLRDKNQVDWLERFEVEHDNLRAVLAWSCEAEENVETGLRMAGFLWEFWASHGFVREGWDWLTRLLALPAASKPTLHRARALNGAGLIAWEQGDFDQATRFLEESLELCRKLGDPAGVAWALNHLGHVARSQNKTEQAIALFTESLSLFRDVGMDWHSAWAINNLGQITYQLGDNKRAAVFLKEARELFERLGDKQGSAWVTYHLGLVAEAQGDGVSAAELLAESLKMFEAVHELNGSAWGTYNLGLVALTQGDLDRAAAYLTESLDLFLNLESRRGSAWTLYHLARVVQLQEQTQRAEGLFRKSLTEFHVEKHLLGETCNLVELAGIAQSKGQLERAARLLGVVDARLAVLREWHLPANGQAKYDSTVANLRTQLGEPEFTTARTAGRALPIDKAMAYVLEKVGTTTTGRV